MRECRVCHEIKPKFRFAYVIRGTFGYKVRLWICKKCMKWLGREFIHQEAEKYGAPKED